jgi:hypothetical protein
VSGHNYQPGTVMITHQLDIDLTLEVRAPNTLALVDDDGNDIFEIRGEAARALGDMAAQDTDTVLLEIHRLYKLAFERGMRVGADQRAREIRKLLGAASRED